MRNFNRVALAAGLTLGFLAGDAAIEPAPHQETRHVTPVDLSAQAAAARKAIAQRYDVCRIAGVVDTHNVQTRSDLVMQEERVPTDEVQITFGVHETAAALRYQALYAHDGSVTWQPVTPMGRTPIPGQHGDRSYGDYISAPENLPSQGNATEFTVPLYPADSYPEGTAIGVFLNQETDTSRAVSNGKIVVDLQVKYCGSIEKGSEGWELAQQAPPMDDFFRENAY